MKTRKSAQSSEGDVVVKRRDVLRLTAALAAFGAAMGLDASTGHAIEYKLQDTMVTSKNGQKEKAGSSNKTQICCKQNDRSQNIPKQDGKSGNK